MQVFHIYEIDSPSIEKWAFRGLQQLYDLTVRSCGIVTPPNIRPVAHSLHHLYLSNNSITSLPANYFEGCAMLSRLSLANNGFRSIPNMTEICDTLQCLDMNNNRLSDISMLYQVRFPRLESLDLANNHIVSFPYLQWRWPRLRVLILHENFLNSMTYQWFWNRDRFISIEAHGNLWNCSQDFCWIQYCNLFTNYTQYYYQCGTNGGYWTIPRDGMKCASPPEWNGMDIAKTGKNRTCIISCETHSAVPSYCGQFFHKYSQKTPHSSPAFVYPTSDWYSASVLVIISVISYNIGPRYNGTRLHCHKNASSDSLGRDWERTIHSWLTFHDARSVNSWKSRCFCTWWWENQCPMATVVITIIKSRVYIYVNQITPPIDEFPLGCGISQLNAVYRNDLVSDIVNYTGDCSSNGNIFCVTVRGIHRSPVNSIFNLVLLISSDIFRSFYGNVNNGSGNGLTPSDSKPSPEPMLTQTYVAIWRDQATMRDDNFLIVR